MKKKVQTILITILITITFGAPYVNAAGIMSNAEEWIKKGSSAGAVHEQIGQQAQKNVSDIASLLYVIGAIVAIVATIVLGIQFITASGSEGKADVKKKAIIVAVGVFVLFASVTIWRLVVGALSSTT